jgi:SAM-dependent methyltransferase
MSQRAPDSGTPTPYTGIENLEVMKEAVNYNRYLLDLVRQHAGSATRIVDFGAGSGTFAAPCTAVGFDVTAVEPDEALRASLQRLGVSAVAAAAALPDRTFHYAYSLNVLEHIQEDVDALRTLREKLVPGARLLVYVPAFPLLHTSMDARVGHIRRYTRTSLCTSIAAAGFEIEQARYADSLGFPATLIFKLLDSGRGNINRTMLRLYDRLVFPLSATLDALTHRWFGKNVFVVGRNPTTALP